MNTQRIRESIQAILNHMEHNPSFWKPIIWPERVDHLRSLDLSNLDATQLEQQLGICYIISPAGQLPNFSEPPFAVVSNNVLEHIFPHDLEALFLQLKNTLPDSISMSHFIDMSDHFAHSDPNINIYNFLKFSEKQWQLIDNDLQPQNRWRMRDYVELFEKIGWEVFHKDFRPGDVEEIKSLRIAHPWASRPVEELAISHCYLGMRKKL